MVAPWVSAGCGGGDQDGGALTGPNPTETPIADVSVSLAGPSTAAVGETALYSIVVSNAGPQPAQSVIVTNSLPSGVSVNTASDGATVSATAVTWPAISSFASGSSRTYTVRLDFDVAAEALSRVASTSSTEDPNPSNNNASESGARVTTTVSIRADILASVTGPQASPAGEPMTYQIELRNQGPSPASGIVLIDSLPEGMDVISVEGNATVSGRAVTWPPLATLEQSASVTYGLTVLTPLVGPFSNRVLATATSPDPSSGNNSGLQGSGTLRTLVSYTPLYTVVSENNGDNFGWEMENVGDVDGDGAGDFAVTAYGGGGQGRGLAYVYSGATGTQLHRFSGQAGEFLGIDMDVPGDLNGDGVNDLVIGADRAASSTGKVYVYSLADGVLLAELTGEASGDLFGTNAGLAGDVNGDGFVDLIIGAPGSSAAGAGFGRAYLYSTRDWSLLYTLDGDQAGSQFGQAARGVGDLDGDGLDDLAIAAPSRAGGGRVYVYSGASGGLMYTLEPDGTSVTLGNFWVSSPGDLNGDGTPDIFTSDLNNAARGGGTGRAYVFSGADGSNLFTWTGETAGDQFGIGHPAGDVDGDGTGDIIIAAWLSSEGGNAAGKTYLYSGATGTVLRTFTSTIPGDNFGFDAFAVDDLNGDGLIDYVISGGLNASSPGRVHVIPGTQ